MLKENEYDDHDYYITWNLVQQISDEDISYLNTTREKLASRLGELFASTSENQHYGNITNDHNAIPYTTLPTAKGRF